MKKILSIFLALILLLACTGCAGGAMSDTGSGGGVKGPSLEGGIVDDAMGDFVADAVEGAPEADGDIKPEDNNSHIQSGTLTAGEWSDLENFDFWTNLLNNNEWYSMMERRNIFANHAVFIRILGQDGTPCYNVPASLLDDKGNVIYEGKSDVQGKVALFYNLTNNGQTASAVKVNEQTYTLDNYTMGNLMDISIDTKSANVQALDLMLMIDTTGSMGDEISYLQEELQSVINRVADDNTALSIKVSVNFYRDETDSYVVRDFDFTDAKTAVSQLKKQKADGGGDYAEAVHLALENIVQGHSWRQEAVKLCFFVLDAPPHSESEIKGINNQMTGYVKAMAQQGIRIIPIASSGINTETEFLLRSWAVMTGGTYTFLTDDSGVGNSHLEPTIGEFEVEKLNNLMVRLINEYCSNAPQPKTT